MNYLPFKSEKAALISYLGNERVIFTSEREQASGSIVPLRRF